MSDHEVDQRAQKQRPAQESRRSFLRKAGMTLGAGVGIALIPAGTAIASSHSRVIRGDGKSIMVPDACGQCCKSTCRSCPAGQHAYKCYDNCCHTSCCQCFYTTSSNCFLPAGPVCC